MDIRQISKDRLLRVNNEQPALKPGQIVVGKVLKLHLNNKAQIQLGSQTMVAQLEAALSAGERYHFQVQATDGILHLKVLGDEMKSQPESNITELMKHLGLKANRANVSFVQNLIQEKIPFEKENLSKAFELLDSVRNKSDAQQILKEMIVQKLPMTDSVFQALFTKDRTGLSVEMKALLQEMRQQPNPTPLQQNLIKQLSAMIDEPLTGRNALISEIIREVTNNSQQLFNVLKVNGAIANDVDFSTWKSKWEAFASQQNITPIHASNQQFSSANTPFPINIEAIEQGFKQLQPLQTEVQREAQIITNKSGDLIDAAVARNTALPNEVFNALKQEITEKILPHLSSVQREELMKNLQNNPVQLRQTLMNLQALQTNIQFEASSVVSKWATAINKTIINDSPLPTKDFNELKQEITDKILPKLSADQRNEMLRVLQNNPVQLRQLLTSLQTFANEETYSTMEKTLANTAERIASEQTAPKEQFLAQVRQMLQHSGMTHESALAKDMIQQEPASIKSMLIELVQQGDLGGKDRAQQLLHFINGLQLQSTNETSTLIQASLQVPGEKLHLNNDLFLDFESRKTEDGKIDADYCRILFYLDLENLKETIIDMNIQKRLVSVTIFNDHNVDKQMDVLQPMLKNGLLALDYQLSTVTLKPLQEVSSVKKSAPLQTNQNTEEGIDYRV